MWSPNKVTYHKQLNNYDNYYRPFVGGIFITKKQKEAITYMDEFLILLQAKLDEAKSKENINGSNGDIAKLQGQLDKLKVQAELDPKSVQKISDDIGKLINQKISISNILVDTKSDVKAGHEYGKQFSQDFTHEISKSKNAIENFEKSLRNAGKETSEIQSIIDKIKELNVRIDSLRFSEDTNGFMNISVSGLDEAANKVKITQSLVQDLQTQQWNVLNTDTSIISTKEIEKANKAYADYTARLAQFKSTNSEILSGLSAPIADFENKLSELKNSIVSIDDVTNSFKSLNAEASNITANFNRQLSPIDSAIRSLSKGEETIAGLRAEFKGLNNAPKEVNTELNKCSSLLAKVKQIESENGRTSDWSQAYKEWANSVDALKAKLTTLKKEQSNVASTQIFKISDLKNNDIAYMSKVYNTIEKQMSEINKMANAKGWNIVDVSGVEQADGKIKQLTLTVHDAEGALKRLTMQREKLQGNGKAQFGLMQVGDVKVIETAAQAQEKLAKNVKKANAKLAEQVRKIQLSIDNGKGASEYQNRINTIIATLERYGVKTEEAKNITTSLQSTFDSMKGMDGQKLVDQADKLEQEFKAVKVSVEQAKLSYDKLMQPATKEKISTTLLKVQKLLDNNTRVTEAVKNEWQSYVNRLSSGSDIAKKEINDISIRLKQTESSMRSVGKLGLSWPDKLKQSWEKFGGWGFATGTMMTLFNQLRRMPKEVYKIDTAMTNLYKVTDETSSKYNQFLNSASNSAQELGRSISSLIEQTANWAKLGFSLDEAEQLAKISSIYTNVGEVDDNTAVSDMVTVMKAFNIEASNSITIVDMLNKLGNEFATSAAALGDGLSRSASAMAMSGTDLNKTLAMLTGGTEITQNASEFGNFLKIGSMRIRGMKGQLEQLGEEVDETVDSISKVQTQILNRTGGKVNIFDNMGNFRDYYDIMKDIAEIYNELSDPDKADLTEILFGKQRGNQGAALIQAFQSGQIQKAYEATQNAAGSAQEEQNRWLQSLEAKTQQFEAAFQSLSNTILDSGLLKWFVDFGTGTIKVFDIAIDKLGTLGSIGLGAGLFAGFKNAGRVKCNPSQGICLL